LAPGGRPPTTKRGTSSRRRAPLVTDRVVDDGDLVTSGDVTSGIDLALHLVARLRSPELADEVAANIEYAVGGPRPSARERDTASGTRGRGRSSW
jgi:transcriptional regulator GlxA family with amidase domain